MINDAQVGDTPTMIDDASDAAASAAAAEVSATAAAQSRADELGVDLSAVAGTGKEGRVTVPDVEAHVEAAG